MNTSSSVDSSIGVKGENLLLWMRVLVRSDLGSVLEGLLTIAALAVFKIPDLLLLLLLLGLEIGALLLLIALLELVVEEEEVAVSRLFLVVAGGVL